MRLPCIVAALVALALSAACGGNDAPTDVASTQATSTEGGGQAVRLTLTESDCVYAGDETVTSGWFKAEVENRSSTFGAFALGRIAEGSTIADLEAYINQEQARWDAMQELRGPPAFYMQVVRVGVAAGESSKLPADVPAGTYALTCFNDDLPTWRGYVATQLDVTG